MKSLGIIKKSLREQLRSLWILALTMLTGPFFVFVYYLISQSTQQHLDILVLNSDTSVYQDSSGGSRGNELIQTFGSVRNDSLNMIVSVVETTLRDSAIEAIKNGDADLLLVIPENFTALVNSMGTLKPYVPIHIELVGDLTRPAYIFSAIWTNEVLLQYLYGVTGISSPIAISETSLGNAHRRTDFDLFMPGLLSLSLIMLMFTATIAFIVEVENKTMIRLKLSRLSTLEFLFGTGIVQIAIGIGSFLLTLLLALSLGFSTDGSLLLVIFIAGICSISIIAFSLIVAALTRTVNEVLVIGNFPLFLFMFFTGAAFPMSSGDMFVFAGYHFPIHGLMSPTHAISALNKVLIMNAGIGEIIPELVSLCGLAIVYFIIGAWAFRWRHMRMG